MKRVAYLLLLSVLACHSFNEQVSDERAVFLPDTLLTGNLRSLESVASFYDSRDLALFWSDGHHYYPSADTMVAIIRKADDFGLISRDYHSEAIEALLPDSVLTEQFAEIDVLLTDAFLTLHHDLRKGRLDPLTFQRHDLSQLRDEEAIRALNRTALTSVSKELGSCEPQAAQYHLLKNALRDFGQSGGKDSVEVGRALKIALNMERWRWQDAWPDRYVVVNIPAYVLRVVEDDSVWLQTAVITGKRETPTPVLRSVIRSFTIYPYWHVPRSIATKEILPSLQADNAYLHRNNFEVLDNSGRVIYPDTIPWHLYNAEKFPFTLRQREGSENSMGVIKFTFGNNYNVYLHDTNSRGLFYRIRRDLSHGCVRVKDAVALAHYLVREDDIYVSPQDLDQYLSIRQRLKIDLRKPIPIRLEYFTAEVENGITFFYEDIYRKDSLMTEALYRSQMVPAVLDGRLYRQVLQTPRR